MVSRSAVSFVLVFMVAAVFSCSVRAAPPSALTVSTSSVSRTVVGLDSAGNPHTVDLTIAYRVRPVAGLAGQPNPRTSFVLVQTLTVHDLDGTIIHTIDHETLVPHDGPRPANQDIDVTSTITWNGRSSDELPAEGIFTFTIDATLERRTERPAGPQAGNPVIKEIAQTTATLPHTVLCDVTPPIVVIHQPADGETVGDVVTVSGRAIDDNLTSVTVNDNPVTTGPDGTFGPLDLDVTTDEFLIHVVARDVADNVGTASVTVERFTMPDVVVTIDSHGSGAFVNEFYASLWGSVTGLDEMGTVMVGDVIAEVSDEQWFASVSLEVEGPNEIEAVATSTDGRSARTALVLVRDTEPPIIVIEHPIDGQVVEESPITIHGTVIDTLSGVAMVTVDGVPVELDDGTFSLDHQLHEGLNEIQMVAIDRAGNSAAKSLRVSLQTIEDHLTISSPATDFVTSASHIVVRGRIEAVEVERIEVNGVAAHIDGRWWEATIPLNEGVNLIVAHAVLGSGDVLDAVTRVISLSHAPSPCQTYVTLTVRRDGEQALVDVGADIHPPMQWRPTTQLISYTLSVNGEPIPLVQPSPNHWTPEEFFGTLDIPTGSPTSLEIRVTDPAGNSSARLVEVLSETSSPYLQLRVPLEWERNLDPQTAASVWVNGSIEDPSSTIVYCNDEVIPFVSEGRFGLHYSFSSPSVQLSVEAVGDTSARSRIVATVHQDSRRPTLDMSDIPSYTNERWFTLQGTVFDEDSGIRHLQVLRTSPATPPWPPDEADYQVAKIDGTHFSYRLELVDGPNDLQLIARNVANLNQVSNTHITLDRTPPSLVVTAPQSGAVTDVARITVVGTAFDDVSGVDEVVINGTAADMDNGSFSGTTLLEPGANDIRVEAVDRAGNITTVTVPVTVVPSHLPPVVEIISPADGSVLGGEWSSGLPPTWDSLGNVPDGREDHAVVAVGPDVYIIGGRIAGEPTSSVLVFQSDSGQWHVGPDLPTARAEAAAAVWHDRIHVVGGLIADGSPTDIHEVLDTTDGSWSSLRPMYGPVHGAALVAKGDSLFLMGGRMVTSPTTESWNVCAQYRVSSDLWSGRLPWRARRGHTATAVGGKIIVAGGRDASGTAIPHVDEFTLPSSAAPIGSWSQLTSLPEARSHHAAAVMEGSIVVAGGYGPSGPVGAVHVFDPTSSSWSTTTPLPRPRGSSPGTIVGRRLLVVEGGHDGTIWALNPDGIVVHGTVDGNPPYEVTAVGQTSTASGAQFEIVVPVTEGPNEVTVTAVDRANQKGSDTITFIYDTTPPTLTVDEPVSGALVPSPVIVRGTVHDATATVVTVNGDPAVIDGTEWEHAAERPDGPLDLEIVATDAAGNETTYDLTVLVDGTPPIVEISSPPWGAFIAGSVEVSGLLVDEHPYSVTFLDTTYPTATDGSFATTLQLADGAYEFDVVGRDLVGNEGSAAVSFVIDTQPPILAVSHPPADLVTSDPSLLVTGNVQDAWPVSLTVQGWGVSVTEEGDFATTVQLYEGPTTIVVVAHDPAGNSSQVTRTVVLDTQPPEVTLSEPPDGFVTNVTQVTVRGFVDEPNLESFTVQGTTVPVTDGAFMTTVSLPEGDHEITVRAVDVLGRETKAVAAVTVDLTPPIVLDLAPSSGSWVNVADCLVSGRAVDDRAVASVSIAGVEADLAADGSFAAVVPLAIEGDNELTVVARDEAGNTTAVPLLLRRDTIAPWASLSPADGTTGVPAETTVVGLFDDALSGVVTADVVLRIDGVDVTEAATVADNSIVWRAAGLNALRPGSHHLELFVVDRAGNTALASSSITVDGQVPPPALFDTAVTRRTFCPEPGVGYGPPGTDSCTVSFTLSSQSAVTLTVRNGNGEIVAIRGTGSLPPGPHSLVWDGLDDEGEFLEAGPYAMELRAQCDAGVSSLPVVLNVRIVY